MSKRLAFYDIECEITSDEDGAPTTLHGVFARHSDEEVSTSDARVTTEELSTITLIEAVAKSGVGTFIDDGALARTQKAMLKLGNVVEVIGTLSRRGEGDNAHGEWSVQMTEAVRVVECWSTTYPGKCFNRSERVRAGGVAATAASTATQNQCKFFINNGTCSKGDACAYAHDRKARAEWIVARKANRRQIAISIYGDPHGETVASKSMRAQKFAEFLCETFGDDALRQGDGVLDVAGGRGDVSFELHTKRNIRSTLVEPRERKLNKSQHKYLKKVKVSDDAPPPSLLCQQIRQEFTPENFHAFSACSVVVGMHPDEATEAIVDFAMKYDKPFAIVPCCVFPERFPHRRDRAGELVTSRVQLVEYLVDKTQAQVAHLDIEGANQVVYSLGGSVP